MTEHGKMVSITAEQYAELLRFKAMYLKAAAAMAMGESVELFVTSRDASPDCEYGPGRPAE